MQLSTCHKQFPVLVYIAMHLLGVACLAPLIILRMLKFATYTLETREIALLAKFV